MSVFLKTEICSSGLHPPPPPRPPRYHPHTPPPHETCPYSICTQTQWNFNLSPRHLICGAWTPEEAVGPKSTQWLLSAEMGGQEDSRRRLDSHADVLTKQRQGQKQKVLFSPKEKSGSCQWCISCLMGRWAITCWEPTILTLILKCIL